MNYKIVRYEKHRNKDGNITSIFLAVTVDNEQGDSTYYEYWLSEDEKNMVIKDEKNLIPILEKVFAQALLKLEKEIENKPQPPLIASEEEKANLLSKIKVSNINKKKQELKQQTEFTI